MAPAITCLLVITAGVHCSPFLRKPKKKPVPDDFSPFMFSHSIRTVECTRRSIMPSSIVSSWRITPLITGGHAVDVRRRRREVYGCVRGGLLRCLLSNANQHENYQRKLRYT